MTDTGIHEPSASKQKGTKNRRRIFALVAVVAIVAGCWYWWRHGGAEQTVLALQPGFAVIKVDQATKTMLITRTNETYLVSCDNACDLFTVGKTYTMRERAGAFEVVRKEQKVQLKILREHIEFDTAPGGHG